MRTFFLSAHAQHFLLITVIITCNRCVLCFLRLHRVLRRLMLHSRYMFLAVNLLWPEEKHTLNELYILKIYFTCLAQYTYTCNHYIYNTHTVLHYYVYYYLPSSCRKRFILCFVLHSLC